MTAPQHIILVGAARSGTKMVRDALAEITGSGAVPYDIGYVWRYGNEDHPDDIIGPDQSSPRAVRFIQNFVDQYATGEPRTVIEKTVGNVMRVPLVAHTFRDATFIHLIRDGVDVAESTRRQWHAESDLRYLMHKARHFPLRLAPRYGTKYALSLARRRLGTDRRAGTWGPRYPGIDEDLRERDLLTVCARQWRQSILCATSDFERLGLPVVEVRYESLVRDPTDELTRIARACGLPVVDGRLEEVSRGISAGRTGIGRSSLTATELASLDGEIGTLLTDLAYDRPQRPEVGDDQI